MVCASCGRAHATVANKVHEFGDLRIRLCADCARDRFRVGKVQADARGEKWDPTTVGKPSR